MAALLASAPPASATALAGDAITTGDLRRHIAMLSSDAFEGRAPGSAGEARTIAYIVEHYRSAGLRAGGSDGWLQPIGFTRRTAITGIGSIVRNGRSIAIAPRHVVVFGTGRSQSIDGLPLTFVGDGDIALPALAGRVAVMTFVRRHGAPPASMADRLDRLRAAGAAAAIVIVPRRYSLAEERQSVGESDTTQDGGAAMPVTAMVSMAAGRRILGDQATRLFAAASRKGFAPVPIGGRFHAYTYGAIERYRTSNIIGRLPGTNPAAGAIVVMAHWDHFGICEPAGEADRICNGAVDNASGVAALIEVAGRLAQGPPLDRDVYFLATTAEEEGLVGSQYFVDHPPFPLASIHAVFNLDSIAIAPRGMPVATVNRAGTTLGPLIDAAARRHGRTVDQNQAADAFIKRQDGWSFTQRRVPAVMVGGSFSDLAKLRAFLRGTYHGPDDELTDATELGGAAEDAELHVTLVRLAATASLYAKATNTDP